MPASPSSPSPSRPPAVRAGGPLERLRTAHRRLLTSQLATDGPQSRADLVRASGLSRTTVSSLVAELIAHGEVVETAGRGAPHKGGSGRPPVLVELTTPPGVLAGVDVGHRHVRVAVADRGGVVRAETTQEFDVDARGAETLDLAAATVRRLVGDGDLVAVGLCVPAPLERGERIGSGIMPGWRGLSPAGALAERLGRPVAADNDANLGALAEHRLGAARGTTHAIYVKAATGVGAGIVLGGRLHRGATGIAGEIGHVQVREDGRVCRCGSRGCLETEVSAPRLLGLLQPAYDDDLDVDRLRDLDADGDPGVRRVLNDAGRVIGRAVADLCTSLNPDVVVVGGSLGSSPALVRGVREAIDRYAQAETAAAVRVVPGDLGDRAEVLGALAIAGSVVPAP